MDSAHGVDWGSGQLEFDVYDNLGPDQPQHGEPLSKLLDSADLLMSYDIVLFACSYNANFAFMSKPEINSVCATSCGQVASFTRATTPCRWSKCRGRAFCGSTTRSTRGCAENKFPPNCNHGPPFDSPAIRVIDSGLSELARCGGVARRPVDQENWNTIGGISVGVVGKDPKSGADITAPPKVWLEGPWTYSSSQIQSAGKDPKAWDASAHHPATVSWSHNCGRVLYTTYHTVGSTQGGKHPGLLPQKMVLFYLLVGLTL